jgi:hypothetical protein
MQLLFDTNLLNAEIHDNQYRQNTITNDNKCLQKTESDSFLIYFPFVNPAFQNNGTVFVARETNKASILLRLGDISVRI